jgi:hypothetical protein
MSVRTRTSGKAVAAFLAGISSVACGVFALASASDLFLVGIPLFMLLALVLGWRAWIEVGRSAGALSGKALAGWGTAIPVVGVGLGFLLLPAT